MTAPLATCHEHDGWRPPGNKSVTLAYRDTLLSHLTASGVTGVHPPPCVPGVAGVFGDSGEVCGLPGWTVLVKRAKTLDLSGTADEAKRRAERDSSQLWATVLHRKGKGDDVGQGYVLLDVQTFIKVLGQLGLAAGTD